MTMWKLVRRLVYQRWFYGFLAAVLWFDCLSDIVDSTREFLSVIFSSAAAILVTLIFLDLCVLSPRERR
jgi:hypothetical protein